ncbi:MAG: hypothetical protein AAGF01_12505 [Cyanobacteria bacterium P01_G01_bin.38]
MQVLFQILHMPRNAWRYSRHRPLEAFCYAGAVLLAAWLARLFLSIVALTLMVGALHSLINQESS